MKRILLTTAILLLVALPGEAGPKSKARDPGTRDKKLKEKDRRISRLEEQLRECKDEVATVYGNGNFEDMTILMMLNRSKTKPESLLFAASALPPNSDPSATLTGALRGTTVNWRASVEGINRADAEAFKTVTLELAKNVSATVDIQRSKIGFRETNDVIVTAVIDNVAALVSDKNGDTVAIVHVGLMSGGAVIQGF